ncbi:MAG: helix-turn-helix transcriptional regulator [Kiritimatiellae bacterium]|nr:helix-turn-helix transcriptional regulator [Kiritimatiellia bacterium]
MQENFSSRLRALRLKSGRSQADICKALDVKQGTYSTWELGKYEPPLRLVVQIAQLFGVTTDYLLGANEESDCCASDESLAKLDGLKDAIRRILDQY